MAMIGWEIEKVVLPNGRSIFLPTRCDLRACVLPTTIRYPHTLSKLLYNCSFFEWHDHATVVAQAIGSKLNVYGWQDFCESPTVTNPHVIRDDTT